MEICVQLPPPAYGVHLEICVQLPPPALANSMEMRAQG
jgi:hypothetical protein